MHAQDIMSGPVITVSCGTPVQDIARLLTERNISAVPVVYESGKLAGIVSEGDLIRRPELGTERRASWWLTLFSDGSEKTRDYIRSHGRTAQDVMTQRVVSVEESTPAATIAGLLERHHIKRVPVLREGCPVGIVSRANLVRALAAVEAHIPTPPEDARELRRAVVRSIEEAGQQASLLNIIVDGDRVQVWGGVITEEERKAVRLAVEHVVAPERVDYRVALLPGRIGAVLWGE